LRLTVTDLACRRGDRQIFADLSFIVEPGELVTITGRNGAGKSSLLAILAGRLRPAAGRIAIEPDDGEPVAERMHLVAHRDGLKTALTARENLDVLAALLRGPAGEGAWSEAASPEEALGQLGMVRALDLPVGYLSAGQRRRVALARLFVAPRPIWLLDEPTSALDVASQARLAELIVAHTGRGGSVIAATHLPLGVEGAREVRIGS
jgi:heme exporter protein A